ncbi:MAG: hypothetical protein AB1391_02665 [Candidatus Micrarchaeota archaeon]
MDQYSLLLQKMPKDELEHKITEKINLMCGFLTRDAAINLLTNELGVMIKERIKLAEIKGGTSKIFVIVKLERILKLQEFDNGKKMRKIIISDQSGERELKLWNKDLDMLNTLHVGDLVEINGIYCKNNELSLGYSGEIKVVQHASFIDLSILNTLEGTRVNVRGYVKSINGMKEYEKNGDQKKMFSFLLYDGKASTLVILWDNPERGNELFIGGEIKLENALVKNGELHLNAFSRLLIKKKREGLSGKIEDITVSEGKLILKIDSNSYSFSREEALNILNAHVADDILLETIVELKKENLLGKNIFIPSQINNSVRSIQNWRD